MSFLLLAAILLLASGFLLRFVTAVRSAAERFLLLSSVLSFALMASMLLFNQPQQAASPAVASPGAAAGPVTLEQADLSQWHTASPSLKSATAYALLVHLRQAQVFKAPIRSVREYQPWVKALKACLDASQAQAEQSLQSLAAGCVQNDGLKRWR
ncbi:MAG: hypothetical protein IGS03_15165 [Candidatus Sericytochromatia bacterium]|nr:hypothetical protein [Candidatus Sericytochromatia bacterium]